MVFFRRRSIGSLINEINPAHFRRCTTSNAFDLSHPEGRNAEFAATFEKHRRVNLMQPADKETYRHSPSVVMPTAIGCGDLNLRNQAIDFVGRRFDLKNKNPAIY
jgi:hypothetical protein